MSFGNLPNWYMQIVLPVLIAFLTGLIGAFFRYLQDRYERSKELRLRELNRAQSIHDDIILSLDRLYTLMKWDVWYIALRHNISTTTGPWKDDDTRWKSYRDALDHWRMNDLYYQSQTKAYFTSRSKAGGPHCTSCLIVKLTETINIAAHHIWRLYWDNTLMTDSNTFLTQQQQEEEDYDPILPQTSNNGEIEVSHRTTTNLPSSSFLTEDETKAKAKYDSFISDMDQMIQTLSWTMTKCIQDENVGKLRK